MNDNVYFIFFEHTQVNLAENRGGSTKHCILKLGGNHAASPAIGQGCSACLIEQVFIVLVNPHVGAVQSLDHLTVNTPGGYTQLTPELLALQRRPLQKEELSILLAKLF